MGTEAVLTFQASQRDSIDSNILWEQGEGKGFGKIRVIIQRCGAILFAYAILLCTSLF